ncbi:MAG: cytochrome c-type biogenesis protein [Betaproteobacteria bacterium]|jgi:cytochrome c-type biogenesis protein CcmH|nr:cytochrome c-type biogenesis protein CcmH [Rubrivivax sp.]MCZ8176428.1 cytochrome c-type biogenesis protein CcmH [Burkholderiaceae bacterium]
MRPGRTARLWAALLLGASLAASAGPAATASPSAATAPSVAQPLFPDAAIEERLTRLSRELRCVVCQNEALSDSPAELAGAMRQEIRDLMKAGKTDREVVDFLTARYGDFVLFRPPLKPLTYLLWVGPFVFLAVGGLVWFVALRARRSFRPVAVDDAQRAAAARLLEDQS